MASGNINTLQIFDGQMLSRIVTTTVTTIDQVIDNYFGGNEFTTSIIDCRSALEGIAGNHSFIFGWFNTNRKYGYAILIGFDGIYHISRFNSSTCTVTKL